MADIRRKRIRLPAEHYLGRQYHFVTLCTEGRRPLFTSPPLVQELLEVLRRQAALHASGIYAYRFMPDHLHLELAGLEENASLTRIMRSYKGNAAVAARRRGIRSLWQKAYYDHIVRANEGIDAVAFYIFNNPVRAGLVRKITEWPHSGSFMFDWKRLTTPAKPFVPPWKSKPTEAL
jgi:putative transposase